MRQSWGDFTRGHAPFVDLGVIQTHTPTLPLIIAYPAPNPWYDLGIPCSNLVVVPMGKSWDTP